MSGAGSTWNAPWNLAPVSEGRNAIYVRCGGGLAPLECYALHGIAVMEKLNNYRQLSCSSIDVYRKSINSLSKAGYFLTHNARCLSFAAKDTQRKKLVLLGTGWGSYSVLKNVNKKKFDVVVVSPRNHFLFTPLLNSTTVGTLEFRSIIEPVRNIRFREDSHFQLARATKLDADNNTLTCSSDVGDHSYELKYDFLVIGVGALSNTFGIPGVSEHAHFLKEIADARAVRNRIITNFEESLYPDITRDEQKRLLHFVIVGGGPTGVEFGAELYDFITEDVTRLFSQEKNLVRVTLIEANEILPSFDRRLRAFAERKFEQRKNYEVLKSRVVEVGRDYVKVEDGTKLPCGMVLWSTGLAPRSFIGICFSHLV